MRRIAAILGACALVLSAGSALGAATPRASVLALESDLVCVTCHETLNMSTSPLAEQMKNLIRKQVAEGWTTVQIEHYFVVHLGAEVLADPPTHGFNLLAWVIPLTVVGLGIVGVGSGAWYWSRNRSDDGDPTGGLAMAGGPPLAPGMDSRIDAELARFDP
jgi:cytochrome c-type biogenesis protein CcmH